MEHNDFSLDGNMDGDCANNISLKIINTTSLASHALMWFSQSFYYIFFIKCIKRIIIYLRKESLWGQLTLQTLLSEGLTHTCSLTAWICLPFKLLMIKSLLLNDCIVAQS